MVCRTLELNVVSAKDLKDVNLLSKMDVYAVVSLSGDSHHHKQKAKTNVAKDSGTNPSWNFPMKFTIEEYATQKNPLTLKFKLRCDCSLGRYKDIGVVYVPIQELLNTTGDNKSMKFVSYQVIKPSGKPQGELNFSYKFGEKVSNAAVAPKVYGAEPVTAYPVAQFVVGLSAPSVGSYPPPPPPPGPGYGYLPPPPYQQPYGGYPPPPPQGYGCPPGPRYWFLPPVQQQQPQRMNNFWMVLRAGLLLQEAIGGESIGDIMSDMGDGDGGFDGGF